MRQYLDLKVVIPRVLLAGVFILGVVIGDLWYVTVAVDQAICAGSAPSSQRTLVVVQGPVVGEYRPVEVSLLVALWAVGLQLAEESQLVELVRGVELEALRADPLLRGVFSL